VSIIFELYNKIQQVEYSIDINDKVKVSVESSGPTKVILNVKEEGMHAIKWFIDNVLYYVHMVMISNDMNKLIFVSCDLLEADTKHSLWGVMTKELSLTKKVGIVHVGDQAYMDPVFNYCKKYIENSGDNVDVDNINKVCFEAYGKRYCDTWMTHKDILSNVSNYYIWDDHEITNDLTLDNIPDDTSKIISQSAVKAYNMYQQSFHVKDTFIINEYCWYKYIDTNKTTVMLAIERTSREITLNEIFDAIKNINEKHKINRLILCFSSAPIPIPHNYYGDTYIMLKGSGKFWDAGKLETLYTLLFDWIEQKEKREVVIIGGDVHFGVHGIAKRKNLTIPVLIASPITNQPYHDRVLASKGMKGGHIIDTNGDITFTTLSTKARRCYGTLDLDSVPMVTNIVYSQDKYPKDLYKYMEAMSKF
jgi:hypothetical protein